MAKRRAVKKVVVPVAITPPVPKGSSSMQGEDVADGQFFIYEGQLHVKTDEGTALELPCGNTVSESDIENRDVVLVDVEIKWKLKKYGLQRKGEIGR